MKSGILNAGQYNGRISENVSFLISPTTWLHFVIAMHYDPKE